MFSTEDVRELLQTFTPPRNHTVAFPSLILASGGQDLVSIQHVQTEFLRCIKEETQRVAIFDLAHRLNVEPEIVRQLNNRQPQPALLSNDGQDVVPEQEREMIREQLHQKLSAGITSRPEFAAQNRIDLKSLRVLLDEQEEQLVDYDDYVCTEACDKILSEQAMDIIDRMISNIATDDYTSKDFAELQGSPPKWLVLQHLERLAKTPDVEGKVIIRDLSDRIRVQSTQAKAHDVKAWIQNIQSRDQAYLDLEVVRNQNRGLYDSIEDVQDAFKGRSDVEVIDTFALSERWFSDLIISRLKALHYSETGSIDVLQDFDEKVQKAPDGHRRFPASLHAHIERKAEQSIYAAVAQPSINDRQFGAVVLTNTQYNKELEALRDLAKEDASLQWERLKDSPEQEIKYQISSITSATETKVFIYEAIAKEKTVQKEIEEQFWTSITDLETENEADFATFWTDRVASRVDIYNEALHAVEDTKVVAQLSDLLATYVQKELVPDSVAKARTHGLVRSRRTKKNVPKLESTLSAATPELPAILSTLDKFRKKQSLAPPTPESLVDYKSSMIQDMQRRMQKATSPPVLFLTLVVILFAQQYPGVVYATGKYAPKLLKLLKAKLEPEQYAKLEAWKEAAKTAKLDEDEKAQMRAMSTV